MLTVVELGTVMEKHRKGRLDVTYLTFVRKGSLNVDWAKVLTILKDSS